MSPAPNSRNHIMSFSGLSPEVRNLIYHALLCPPDGVYLQSDAHRWAWATSNRFGDSEEDEEEDDDGKDICQREKKSPTASAAIPVSTAIFYVSHQIQQEASQVFYGFNRFTFDSACTALEFLDCPRPSFRHYIKDIAFTRMSTCADDGDCTQFWEPLCEFINRHMPLESVTIQVPRDHSRGIDKTKEAREAPDSEWYWWPAPRLLTASLMAGKLQKLRIGYSATLKICDSEEEAQRREAGLCQHKDPLEDLDSISELRYPRPQEELEREFSESKALRSALAQGLPHEFGTQKELLADQDIRRQRFNFVVSREDDPISDLGTVLVLTRPTASSVGPVD